MVENQVWGVVDPEKPAARMVRVGGQQLLVALSTRRERCCRARSGGHLQVLRNPPTSSSTELGASRCCRARRADATEHAVLGRMELVVMYSNMVAHLSLCGWGDSGAAAAEHSVGGIQENPAGYPCISCISGFPVAAWASPSNR